MAQIAHVPMCPVDPHHGYMRYKAKGRKGPFWSCSRYPDCRGMRDAATGKAIEPPKPRPGAPPIFRPSPVQARRNFDQALYELDDDQQQVVAWRPDEDPTRVLRVVAGAGSGKTRALVTLVAALLYAGVTPERLLVTTFSSDAAQELKSRLSKLIPSTWLFQLALGTFHGLALRQLRSGRFAYKWAQERNIDGRKADRAADVPAAMTLWRSVLGWQQVPGLRRKGLNIDLESYGVKVGDYARQADLFRSSGLWAGAPVTDPSRDVNLPHQFRRAWKLFEEAKKALKAWDYADALAEWNKTTRADAKRGVGGKIVLVDEAQDDSKVQLKIGESLSTGDAGRLFLIGDPRQCVLAGQLVNTPDGWRPVESIQGGDLVFSSRNAEQEVAEVLQVSSRAGVGDRAFRFTLADGTRFAVTAKHTLYAACGRPLDDDHTHVYLQYRPGYGYRIGQSRSGAVGLRHRAQVESATRVWFLDHCRRGPEALRREHGLAYQYGIPMAPFKPRRGSNFGTPEETMRWFQEHSRPAKPLFDAFRLDFERPAFMAGTHRQRVVVHYAVGTRHGASVTCESSAIPEAVDRKYGFRDGRRGTRRIRRDFPTGREARDFAKNLAFALNGAVSESLSCGNRGWRTKLAATTASSVVVGSQLPTFNQWGQLTLQTVVAREAIPATERVYDLEVPRSTNFEVRDPESSTGAVVGNCIHVWRGAYPDLFVKADETHGARTLFLPRNYRSGSLIVRASNLIAANQEWSLGPDARAIRGEAGFDGVVTGKLYGQSPGEEARGVAEEIAGRVAGGTPPGDIAVLARTNGQAGLFESSLVAARVPVAVAGREAFLMSDDAQTFLAYCLLVQGPFAGALDRACNRPNRYIKRKALVAGVRKRMRRFGDDRATPLLDAIKDEALVQPARSRSRSNILDLANDIARLRAVGWPAAATEIADLMAQPPTKARKATSGTDPEDDRLERLYALADLAEGFDCPYVPPDEAKALQAQGKDPAKIGLVNFAGACNGRVETGAADGSSGRVTVSTVHRSKGREWPIVYVSASKLSFPLQRSPEDEERRLFYVAISRPKDELRLSWAAETLPRGPDRVPYRAGPSPFLRLIEEVLPEGTLPRRSADDEAEDAQNAAMDTLMRVVRRGALATPLSKRQQAGVDKAEVRAAKHGADVINIADLFPKGSD